MMPKLVRWSQRQTVWVEVLSSVERRQPLSDQEFSDKSHQAQTRSPSEFWREKDQQVENKNEGHLDFIVFDRDPNKLGSASRVGSIVYSATYEVVA